MIEYVKEDQLYSAYTDAVAYMQPLFQPLKEFERIARNRPHPGIADGLPKVTDGTLAAIIQETPKRIIQQIPTGQVEADDEWLDIVAGFILEHEILPNSDYVADLIQKCWALVSKALTYGAQPAFVQFVNRGDYFGTDFTLPYVKDVLLEPGKLSDKDSNVIMLRSWYQPNDIDAIIDKEATLAKKAKARGEEYESGWDTKALKNVKTRIAEKDANSRTPNEDDKGTKSSGIEIIHVFQRGIDSQFYSFATATKEVVRRKKNPDPRGGIPIHYMYANVDLSNPLGRGAIELSGGMQNLLDSEVQSYQYMRALLMNPPLKVRGSNITASSLKYKPKAIWKLGSDENADVTPVDLSTSSLERFPENYGLIKSQILNLNSSSDTSVSAESGNPGYSKTQAGVQALQLRLGVSDNYLRKQFEAVFQEICETEVNLWFAERSGVQELQLDKNTAAKVRALAPDAVSEDNKIAIDYDDETPKLKFRVDASSSSLKDNQEQVEVLGGLLERIEASPLLTQLVGEERIGNIWNAIVAASGAENSEKLSIDTEQETDPETGQPVPKPGSQQQGPSPEDIQQMVAQMLQEHDAQKPQLDPRVELIKAMGIKFEQLPESTRQWVLGQLDFESQGDPTGAEKKHNVEKFSAAANQAGAPDVELDQRDAQAEAQAQALAARAQQQPQSQQPQPAGAAV